MPASNGRVHAESGRPDYHDPTAGWAGAPPARSALTARLVLAIFGAATCGVGASAFLVVADVPAIAGVLAFLGLVAVVDLVIVVRRKRGGEPG